MSSVLMFWLPATSTTSSTVSPRIREHQLLAVIPGPFSDVDTALVIVGV
ncbi:MAG: hypothetical protein LBK72_04890 [Bifidobacteriaceae bacterium]|nr:hypothetical protein [Bifidobacteriaceae bacterium]